MGIPYRVVISDKTLEDQAVEITERKTGKSKVVSIEEFKKMLKK
jgi:glycyl-tRNA synthetase (class II)